MKILVISESVSLAHMIRPLEVAQALHESGHDVTFAVDTRETLPGGFGTLKVRHLSCIGQREFLSRVRGNVVPYTKEELREYVDDDRSLIQEINPDLIVHDFRTSLQLSPDLTTGRLCTIGNRYWADVPQRIFSMPYPQAGVIGKIAATLPRPIAGMLGALADRMAAAPFDAVARERDISAAGRFSRYMTAGDYSWYADPVALFPGTGGDAEKRELSLGHISWLPPRSLLEPLPEEPVDVYVALGSSGPEWILPQVISVLQELNLSVLVCSGVTAAGADFQISPRTSVVQRRLVDGNEAARRARLMICNGGSPAVYQGFEGGCRVLGICSNFDQALCMDALRTYPGVASLPLALLSASRMRQAVQSLLEERTVWKGSTIARGVQELPATPDIEMFDRRETLKRELDRFLKRIQVSRAAPLYQSVANS